MMYRIDTEKEATRQVQTYLSELSHADKSLPRITVDGIYGKETAEAVRAFQGKWGLAVTGEVDDATFLLLFQKFEAAREERIGESELIPAIVFPLQMGDSGSHVRILQSTLDEILGTRIPKDGFFGKATEDGVRSLQRHYGLLSDGTVNRALWVRIAKDYRTRVKEKFSP